MTYDIIGGKNPDEGRLSYRDQAGPGGPMGLAGQESFTTNISTISGGIDREGQGARSERGGEGEGL